MSASVFTANSIALLFACEQLALQRMTLPCCRGASISVEESLVPQATSVHNSK
jgi:hypothetical protein